ncbi:hypothetical protein ACOSQ4_012523 [Xanthoceras sorbifolium]
MERRSYNWEKWKNLQKEGPWGSQQEGTAWSYTPTGPIIEIDIWYDYIFNSITFKSINEGTVETSGKFGGGGGKRQDIISLEWPDEYLTAITGISMSWNL